MVEPMMIEPSQVQVENIMIGMLRSAGCVLPFGAGGAMDEGPLIKSAAMFSPSLSGPLDVKMFEMGAMDLATEGVALIPVQGTTAALASVPLGLHTRVDVHRLGGHAELRVVLYLPSPTVRTRRRGHHPRRARRAHHVARAAKSTGDPPPPAGRQAPGHPHGDGGRS